MDPYKTLGIPSTATKEEAKATYRKLANQHHPDKGGDEEKFKEIKAAWEQIENPPKEQAPSWRDFSSVHRHADMASRFFHQMVQTIRVDASLKEAMTGFTRKLMGQKGEATISLPGGLPPGLILRTEAVYGDSTSDQVDLVLNIVSPEFHFKNSSIFNGYASGDLIKRLMVDALTMMRGGWVEVVDPMGDTYSVRVPEGISPGSELKVKGKGYPNWVNGQPGERADLYLMVVPTIRSISNIPITELEELLEHRRKHV